MLIADIRDQMGAMNRLRGEMENYLGKVEGDPPQKYELRVIGGILHDFYTCLERIFHKIALKVDGEVPAGDSWHADLLRQMGLEIPELRVAVIDDALEGKLREYLRFRHVFRNVYGFELDWDRFHDLVEEFEKTAANVRTQLEVFLQFLETTYHALME